MPGPTRRYRPGGNKRYTAGTLSEDCVAFLNLYWGSLKIFVKTKEHDPEKPTEPGPNVVFLFAAHQKPSISVELSALTQQELEELGKFLEFAGGLTQSLIRHRDEEAARAYAEGDDTFVRSYRPVPQLVVRDGQVSQHLESLRIGPEGIPGQLGQRLVAEGAGRNGNGLAEPDSRNSQPEDDGQETDQP